MLLQSIGDFLRLKPLEKNHALKIYGILLGALCFRFCLAVVFPITNDEAYYWDWAHDPQMSYFDHPPGVSYVTWAGVKAFGIWGAWEYASFLEPRLFVPFLFLITSLFLVKSCLFLSQSLPKQIDKQSSSPDTDSYKLAKNTAWVLALVPGISFLGVFALPDIGLSVGISALLYASLRSIHKKSLRALDGMVYGILLGISGLFKYHALLTGGGLALGFFLSRVYERQSQGIPLGKNLRWDGVFWMSAVAVGALCCLPVWIWNYQKEGASILFQLDHGFGGPRLSVLTAVRLVLAQVVLLGPLYFLILFRVVGSELLKRKFRPSTGSVSYPLEPSLPLNPGDMKTCQRIFLWGSLPLMVTILGASFFKEMMPHWLLPAWLLLVPWVAVKKNSISPRLLGVWPALLMILSLVLSEPHLRAKFLEVFKGDPGPLSELTVWEPLARAVSEVLQTEGLDIHSGPLGGDRCPGGAVVGGARWYSVAQLRFHLPYQPQVLSFDPHHHSYYHDRDIDLRPVGCKVALVALDKSLDLGRIGSLVRIDKVIPLRVMYHEKQPWILIRGTLVGGGFVPH